MKFIKTSTYTRPRSLNSWRAFTMHTSTMGLHATRGVDIIWCKAFTRYCSCIDVMLIASGTRE